MFDLMTEDGFSCDCTCTCQMQGSVSTTFISRTPEEGYSSQGSTGVVPCMFHYWMKKSTCGIIIMSCMMIPEDCVSTKGHPIWSGGLTLRPDFGTVPFKKVLSPLSVSGLTTLSFPAEVTLRPRLR